MKSFSEQIQRVNSYQKINFVVNQVKENHFVVYAPWCDRSLPWHIMYSKKHPENCPEIVLHEDCLLDSSNVPSLAKWNSSPDDLLNCLLELLEAYRNHILEQICISTPPALQFEARTVGMTPDSQVIFQPKEKLVLFYLPILIPETPLLTLILQYSFDFSQPTPRLDSSSSPNFWTPFLSSFRFPTWTTEMCGSEYIHVVQQSLLELLEVFKKRMAFIKALNQTLGIPLEFDSKTFSSVNYLIITKTSVFHLFGFFLSFFFLLKRDKVNIPQEYPNKQPILTLSSASHFVGNRPQSLSFSNYPFSPRWDPSELATRISNFIPEAISKF